MPKAKLTVSASEVKKLKVAAEVSRVSIVAGKKIGNDVIATVSTPDPANLFMLGKMFATVEGNEYDKEFAEAEAKEKETQAAAKKGGSK